MIGGRIAAALLLAEHECALLLEEALEVIGSLARGLVLLLQLSICLVLFGHHLLNSAHKYKYQ